MGMRRSPIVFLVAAVLGSAHQAIATPADQSMAQSEIRETLAQFLQTFDNLDWPRFRDYFAEDATMFHPGPPNVKRIDSPLEFEKAWLVVFARIKTASGRSAPPYMSLQPQDVKIQMLSNEIALVTFHLMDANVLSRRTIVLRHDSGRWKIVHLHASNLTLAAP